MLSEKIVKEVYEEYGESNSHRFDHVFRVHRNAMKICSEFFNVDEVVVDAASWLHDVARNKERSGGCKCHAQEGAILSKKILSRFGYFDDQINRVSQVILEHRYSMNTKPSSLESKILQDADRLDAIGAIAIARIFMYAGATDRPLHDLKIEPGVYKGNSKTTINHFYEKNLKITPSSFHTAYARDIARERYIYIKEYIYRFNIEWMGTDLI